MADSQLAKFSQSWLLEPLQESETFTCRRMFGGLATYWGGRIVCVLMEDPKSHSYRGRKFEFPIWNGVLIPTEKEFHTSLKEDFPALLAHPVLGKWMYLPMTADTYEDCAKKIVSHILKHDLRVGIEPRLKPGRHRKAMTLVRKFRIARKRSA